MSKPKQRNKIVLSPPPELHAAIKESARLSGRTMPKEALRFVAEGIEREGGAV